MRGSGPQAKSAAPYGWVTTNSLSSELYKSYLPIITPGPFAYKNTIPAPQGTAVVCPQGCEQPNSDCQIKGNITPPDGVKEYYLPGWLEYEDIIIDPQMDERWFCTEEEAHQNGWQPASSQ